MEMNRIKGFFVNLSELKNGYTFAALFRILQADVPVIIVTETAVEDEIQFLKKARKNLCVIAVDNAWKKLKEWELLPDFLVGDNLGRFDESMNDVAVIANAEREEHFLQQHRGKQFFYWTENEIVRYLCEEAQKEAGYPYAYNIMEIFEESKDVYERAFDVAKYIGATDIRWFGARDGRDKEYMDDLAWMEEWGRAAHIECHIRETLEELLPLLDVKGKNAFDHLVNGLAEKAEAAAIAATWNVRLYSQLFQMARAETVYQEDLNDLVAKINQCTKKISEFPGVSYIGQVANEMRDVREENGEDKAKNEIERAALNEKAVSEKMKEIFVFVAKEFMQADLTRERKEHGNSVKKRKTVLLVCGDSQYDVLPGFVMEIKKGILKLGYDVYVWNMTQPKTYGYNIYQNTVGYDFIILMNGVAIDFVMKDIFLQGLRVWYDKEETKAAAIFMDHPRRHIERLKYARDGVEVFLGDKYWCEYIERYMPEVSGWHYLPMAGVEQEDDIRFFEKENKIVFFGSGEDLSGLAEEINACPNKDFIWMVIEALMINPQYTEEEMIRRIGRECGCQYSAENLMLYADVLLLVQTYVRRYFRKKVIEEIAKSGIPFDIYGWRNDELERYENVTLKEKVNFREMLSICQHTRFILNVQPWTKDGTQERVFNTMLGGSVVVTDVSDSLEREFCDGESILFYRLNEIEKLPGMITYYMEHPQEAQKIAQNGYEIAGKKHTWANYAKDLMDILDRGERGK